MTYFCVFIGSQITFFSVAVMSAGVLNHNYLGINHYHCDCLAEGQSPVPQGFEPLDLDGPTH